MHSLPQLVPADFCECVGKGGERDVPDATFPRFAHAQHFAILYTQVKWRINGWSSPPTPDLTDWPSGLVALEWKETRSSHLLAGSPEYL